LGLTASQSFQERRKSNQELSSVGLHQPLKLTD
jgi:hypothetical protein